MRQCQNQWNCQHSFPIPQNRKKSLSDSQNYRTIALSSILGKVLDHTILLLHSSSLSTSDLQFGFKKRHGTVQCTYVLNEITQYYLHHNSHVHVVLLDASQAFDRVNYVNLLQLLLKRNLSPVICRLLLNMYTDQEIRVRWGTSLTTTSHVCNGVKQGGVLSPILFTVYIDELLQRLNTVEGNESWMPHWASLLWCLGLCWWPDSHVPDHHKYENSAGHMPSFCKWVQCEIQCHEIKISILWS